MKKSAVKTLLALFLAVSIFATCLPFGLVAKGEEQDSNQSGDIVDTLPDDTNGQPIDNSAYDKNGDGYVEYLSLGDSLTNGFGMDGYFNVDGEPYYGTFPLPDVDKLSEGNVLGYQMYVEDSYPYMLNEYFNGDNLEHWDQLALSGMRAEELMYVLTNGQYPLDGLTGQSTLDVWKSYNEVFVESITKAEVITLNIGNYSFSSAMAQRLNAFISGNTENDYDGMTMEWLFETFPQYSNLQPYYQQLSQLLQEQAVQMLGDSFGKLGVDFVDGLVYATFSYVIAYNEVVATIHTLNPDAKTIVMGMPNFLQGISLKVDENTLYDFGEYFQIVVDFVNLHRAYTVASCDCLFVELSNDMPLLLNSIADGTVHTTTLLRSLGYIIDDFNLAQVFIDSMVSNFPSYMSSIVQGVLEEEITANSLTKAWITFIRTGAFPDDFMPTIKGILGLFGAYGEVEQMLMGVFDKMYSAICQMATFDGECDMEVIYEVVEVFGSEDGIYTYVGETMAAFVMSTDDSVELPESIKLMGHVYLRCMQGDVVLGHPNREGHQGIFQSIVNAMENNYHGKDYMTDFVYNLYYGNAGKIVKQYWQMLVEEASHQSYYKKQGDVYLALGGKTANGYGLSRRDDTYVDIIAEHWGFAESEVVKLADNNLTMTNVMQYLSSCQSQIESATVISFQQDVSVMLLDAFNGSADWNTYFEGEQLQVVEQVKQKLFEQLPQGAEMIQPILENFAYAMVAYVLDTYEAVGYIQSINPNAQLLLVGMYNPLQGLKISLGEGETVDVGEYLDYVVEVTNAYYVVCASAYQNVTFVDVSDTQIHGFDSVIDMSNLDYSQIVTQALNILRGSDMFATAQGHAYIAERIKLATEVRVTMLGDVNGDGKISIADVATIQAFTQNKTKFDIQQMLNADVNGDGKVTADDSKLLYAKLRNVA